MTALERLSSLLLALSRPLRSLACAVGSSVGADRDGCQEPHGRHSIVVRSCRPGISSYQRCGAPAAADRLACDDGLSWGQLDKAARLYLPGRHPTRRRELSMRPARSPLLHIRRDVPGHRDVLLLRPLGRLLRVVHLDLGEVERDVLGQPVLAAGAAGRDRGDDHLLHRDLDVFERLSPALRRSASPCR